MLDKEFKYHLDHQEELIPLYDGKYIVIMGNQVVGAYDNREDAYTVRYYNRVSPVITAETTFSFDIPSSRVIDYTKE